MTAAPQNSFKLRLPSAAERPKLSRFGPRHERESKRIRRWAEVGSSEKLAAATCAESPRGGARERMFNDMFDVEKETQHLETLEQALQWARARTPRAVPLETIPQDEYTHDVIFQTRENEFLVFDAT